MIVIPASLVIFFPVIILIWNLYVTFPKFNDVNVKITIKSETVDLNPGFCFCSHLLALFSELFPSVYISGRDREQMGVEVTGFCSWKGSSKSYPSGIFLSSYIIC